MFFSLMLLLVIISYFHVRPVFIVSTSIMNFPFSLMLMLLQCVSAFYGILVFQPKKKPRFLFLLISEEIKRCLHVITKSFHILSQTQIRIGSLSKFIINIYYFIVRKKKEKSPKHVVIIKQKLSYAIFFILSR